MCENVFVWNKVLECRTMKDIDLVTMTFSHYEYEILRSMIMNYMLTIMYQIFAATLAYI